MNLESDTGLFQKAGFSLLPETPAELVPVLKAILGEKPVCCLKLNTGSADAHIAVAPEIASVDELRAKFVAFFGNVYRDFKEARELTEWVMNLASDTDLFQKAGFSLLPETPAELVPVLKAIFGEKPVCCLKLNTGSTDAHIAVAPEIASVDELRARFIAFFGDIYKDFKKAGELTEWIKQQSS